MQYRRAKTPGATYFFTLVTHHRRPIFCQSENIDLLRDAFRYVMKQHPFKIDAIVILRDHLHCLWTLPDNDADFSTRVRLIKSYFSRKCHASYQGKMTFSRQQKGEKAIWQRRFWEHQIRDERDACEPFGICSFSTRPSRISHCAERLAVFEFSPLCCSGNI